MSIDLSAHFYPWLNASLAAAALALAGYAVFKLRAWVNARLDWMSVAQRQQLVATLDGVLHEAIDWALSQLQDYEQRHQTLSTPSGVKGWLTAKAGQYAVDHAGDELDQLGYSPEALAAKLEARLPAVVTTEGLEGTQVLTVGHVDVRPLPPLAGVEPSQPVSISSLPSAQSVTHNA